jgi:hypothetical protein
MRVVVNPRRGWFTKGAEVVEEEKRGPEERGFESLYRQWMGSLHECEFSGTCRQRRV